MGVIPLYTILCSGQAPAKSKQCWRGGATHTVECGMDKMTIKKAGQWNSDAVKGYFPPEKAGVQFTAKALMRL